MEFAYVGLGLIAGAALLAVVVYNRLVALSRRCDQAGADIDVQLKLRHDLVPSLVETVKGYAAHERTALEAVIKARAAAVAAPRVPPAPRPRACSAPRSAA